MERGIAVRTTLPPRLRSATGDRRRVEQIVTNLAANGLKFAPAGSSLELAGWFDGSVALVAVRDEGSGIGADDRDRIFERFYRMAGHDRITGTGLGLPIARDLARAMGGDLVVAQRARRPAPTFLLALPGPTSVAPDVVGETLARVLAAEELAPRGAGRPARPSPPALTSGVDERAPIRPSYPRIHVDSRSSWITP